MGFLLSIRSRDSERVEREPTRGRSSMARSKTGTGEDDRGILPGAPWPIFFFFTRVLLPFVFLFYYLNSAVF